MLFAFIFFAEGLKIRCRTLNCMMRTEWAVPIFNGAVNYLTHTLCGIVFGNLFFCYLSTSLILSCGLPQQNNPSFSLPHTLSLIHSEVDSGELVLEVGRHITDCRIAKCKWP